MTRKLFILAALATLVLAMAAVPALAEGYNTGADLHNRANGYFSGPHGGYTTTTNKCQDCHSTHYASGSYVLLRANSREAACDYCHAGGGGSTINIQMDNAYNATADITVGADASAIATTTMGYGTGHTLGYQGNAPADINPAFTSDQGFACFDCHTPHGNSARVLTTFANPGRVFSGADTTVDQIFKVGSTVFETSTVSAMTFYNNLVADNGTAVNFNPGTFWGVGTVEGNIYLMKKVDTTGDGVNDASDSWKFMKKPIWPTGRFLLLKNPDVETSAGVEVADTNVTDDGAGSAAYVGYNKLAIDWDDPLGPANAAYGGEQDNAAANSGAANHPWGPGLMAVSEFCQDCHDGTGGASTQPATVWVPNASDSTTGSYQVAYSHDAQPRH